MDDPIQELDDEEIDVEYQTPSTSEVDIENNSTDNKSDEQNGNAEQYDVLTRTFRDYFINEITETFADELDALRKKEAFFGPDKLQILSDCLAQGVNLFSQTEKELYLFEKLSDKKTKSDKPAVVPPNSSQSSSTPKSTSKSKSQTPSTPKEQDAMEVEEPSQTVDKQKKEKKKKKHKRDSSTPNGNT